MHGYCVALFVRVLAAPWLHTACVSFHESGTVRVLSKLLSVLSPLVGDHQGPARRCMIMVYIEHWQLYIMTIHTHVLGI